MRLYTLANSVWHADDWYSGANTNPMTTDLYLFDSEEKAEEQAKKVDADDDIYNDGTIYTAEVDEGTILEESGCETMEDFLEMLNEPYSTEPRKKNYGEDEKSCVADWIVNNADNEWPCECSNYDFEKSIKGAIIVVWSWQTYVGYAREIKELRYAREGEDETLLTKADKTYVNQVDIVMTAEEVEEAGENLQNELEEKLHQSYWRWNNESYVDTLIKGL